MKHQCTAQVVIVTQESTDKSVIVLGQLAIIATYEGFRK